MFWLCFKTVFTYLSLLIWTADCTQFLSENCLNRCQIFGRLGFYNRIQTNFLFSAHPYNTRTLPSLYVYKYIGNWRQKITGYWLRLDKPSQAPSASGCQPDNTIIYIRRWRPTAMEEDEWHEITFCKSSLSADVAIKSSTWTTHL